MGYHQLAGERVFEPDSLPVSVVAEQIGHGPVGIKTDGGSGVGDLNIAGRLARGSRTVRGADLREGRGRWCGDDRYRGGPRRQKLCDVGQFDLMVVLLVDSPDLD